MVIQRIGWCALLVLKGAQHKAMNAAKILLVDDDAAVRSSVGNVLQAAGYEPVLADSGEVALEKLKGMKADLLLLDLGLPTRSGWEVLERIKTDYPGLPVIIVTGLSNQHFSALAAGVNVLMEKPLDVHALLRCIEELLAKRAEGTSGGAQGSGGDFKHVPPGMHVPQGGSVAFHAADQSSSFYDRLR